MKYTLYMHKNKINNKVYIGITSKNPIARWGHNGIGYKTQTYFWKEIQEFGWDNFEHIIIQSDLEEEDACRLEIELIQKYDSSNPEYGYNYKKGGNIQTEESRRKISISETGEKHHYYGQHRDEETRRKISESLSGPNHYWYGKHLPQETIDKIIEAKTGMKYNIINKNWSAIRCIETGVVYDSMSECERETGISHGLISRHMSGKIKAAKGFHFEYCERESA